jgi:hypothetical protein
MAYQVTRDLAAFVGAVAAGIVGFATWQTLRAHNRALDLSYLNTTVGQRFYFVRISVANLTPSERQVDEAWLDLAPPVKARRVVTPAINTLAKLARRLVRRKTADFTVLSVRGAMRQAVRNFDWVRAASLGVQDPLYIPFKIGAFDSAEGTLLFPLFPLDEELLDRHGKAASRAFLDMLGQKVERAFIARLTIKDDRGKRRPVWAFVLPAGRAVS